MFHLLPHSPAPTGSHTRAAQTGRQAESSTTAAPRPGSAPPFCARLLTARVCSWFGRCPKGRDLSDKVRWAAFCFWISSFTVFFFLHRHHLPFRQLKCGSKHQIAMIRSQAWMHTPSMWGPALEDGPALCTTLK